MGEGGREELLIHEIDLAGSKKLNLDMKVFSQIKMSWLIDYFMETV